MSIRLKITAWFTLALLLVMGLTYFVTFRVSRSVMLKNLKDEMVYTVEDNKNDVIFQDGSRPKVNSEDQLIEYRDGTLVVDDDYLDQVNGIRTALYSTKKSGKKVMGNELLYGEDPIAVKTLSLPFENKKVRSVSYKGQNYFLYDRKLTQYHLENIWLRAVVSYDRASVYMSDLVRLSLYVMPLLVLIAILGGYLIACRALRPIRDINRTVSNIYQSGDLTRRIEIDPGRDEVHMLAENFNRMLGRIEDSFEEEKRFTSDASHELRTPSQVIMTQCETALDRECSPEEYQKALETIQRQNVRMSDLIEDMLNYSRIGRNAANYRMEPVDMSEICELNALDLQYTDMYHNKAIHISCQAPEAVLVLGDQDLLTRLVINLMDNACKYGKQGGHIDVRVSREQGRHPNLTAKAAPDIILACEHAGYGTEGGRRRRTEDGIEGWTELAVIRVKDDGIGMTPDQQNQIFRRFYQADPSRTNHGFGLGLAIVREIVLLHGGFIDVKSKPGEGSEFTVTLPLYRGAPDSRGEKTGRS